VADGADTRHPVMPPVYLLGAILAMVGLHFGVPVIAIVPSPLNWLGVVPLVAGVVMVLWSASAFSRAGTAIRPFQESSDLVTHGLYRYSRNPIYLGMVISLLGLAAILGSATPVLVIPFFIWIIQSRFIVFEERGLERTFGERFTEYRMRVRRWI